MMANILLLYTPEHRSVSPDIPFEQLVYKVIQPDVFWAKYSHVNKLLFVWSAFPLPVQTWFHRYVSSCFFSKTTCWKLFFVNKSIRIKEHTGSVGLNFLVKDLVDCLSDVSYPKIYTRTTPGRYRVTIIVIWSTFIFLHLTTTLTIAATHMAPLSKFLLTTSVFYQTLPSIGVHNGFTVKKNLKKRLQQK